MNNHIIPNIYQYLKKYLPTLDTALDLLQQKEAKQLPLKKTFVKQNSSEQFSKNLITTPIWQFCWQGTDSVPPIVQKCLFSVEKFHADKRILINASNYQDYIELPDYIYEKFQNRILNHAHLSDYIRLSLLEKYGGTWVDATIFLSAPLPESILSQDFFVFKFPLWNNIEEIYKNSPSPLFDIKKGFDFPFRSSANWFIHSLQHNPLISGTKTLLEAYWQEENELVHYFLFHILFSMILLHRKECMKIFQKIHPVFGVEACHLLQYFLPREFSQETFSTICTNSCIHKLTYKYQRDKRIENSFIKHILEMDSKPLPLHTLK